ncbi:MAG: DUF2442 domain-containing protein [Spirosoma sp.]|nr:DUF2442 domain-containing protein [Spirosoma sp.]
MTAQTKNFVAQNVWFDETRVYVELNDGRVIGSPLSWFPRLQKATPEQCSRFELTAGGYGIHWKELDEDLTANGFLTYSHA